MSKKHPRTNHDGLVLCDNCDNPASLSLLKAVGWDACAVCCFGESDALEDYGDSYRPEDRPSALDEYREALNREGVGP